MRKNIKFVDAQDMHKQYPETFEVPTNEELSALKPGDFVKVCAYNERFWAEITAIDGKVITARVDNDLITRALSLDDIISFGPQHVYSILSKNDQIHQSQKIPPVILKEVLKNKIKKGPKF